MGFFDVIGHIEQTPLTLQLETKLRPQPRPKSPILHCSSTKTFALRGFEGSRHGLPLAVFSQKKPKPRYQSRRGNQRGRGVKLPIKPVKLLKPTPPTKSVKPLPPAVLPAGKKQVMFIPRGIPRPPAKKEKTPTKRTLHAQKRGPAPDMNNYSHQSQDKRVYDPNIHCGAQLRKKERGRLCRQMKGAKTPHKGDGKCWLHGGLTPIKHGLNSLVQHGRLKDIMRKMAEIDHDVLDLTPEINLLRALTIDYVNRYDDFIEKLDAWYDGIDAARAANTDHPLPPIPRRFPSLEEAGPLLEAISRMVERIHKITREGSITLPVFRGLMTEMGMVVANEVADPQALAKIEKGWTQLMVNPKSYVKDSPDEPEEEDE